jgi:hypothetical protein
VKAAFFALVRAGLWEKEVRLLSIGDVDFDKILQIADEQAVDGIVAEGLEHVKDIKVPQEVVLQFVGSALQIEQQNQAMNTFVASLIEEMRNAGIYTLLLKGQGVAQCYNKPLWRTSGDVDLFLSDENYRKAKDFLRPLASSVDDEGLKNKHLGLTIDDYAVELHGTLYGGLSSRIENTLDDIKKTVFYEGKVRSWMNGKTQVFLLGVDEEVVYLFTHILQHFYKGGVGIRQICDWSRLLWTYRDSLNHGLLESRIRKAGLMSEWKAFGAFAVEYLGMPVETMPFYSADAKWKRKADKICAFILEVGNFGNKRDMSYFNDKSYLMQKVISLGRRCGDLWRHSMIFPVDSVKFFPRIMLNGLMSAVRGE